MQISTALKLAGRFLNDNSPAILTGVAVSGVISTAVLTHKATREHISTIEQIPIAEMPLGDRKAEFKAVWQCYVPPVLVGSATIACIVGAHSVGSRRTAALAGAYSLTQQAFDEYQVKVRETIGEKKELAVRDEIAADRVKANPVKDAQVIITGAGDVLCYDTLSGRYFRSSHQKIQQAEIEINKQVINEMLVPLSEFYSLIGLSANSVSHEIGFTTDRYMDIHYSSTLHEESSEPCLAITFQHTPIREFNFHG